MKVQFTEIPEIYLAFLQNLFKVNKSIMDSKTLKASISKRTLRQLNRLNTDYEQFCLTGKQFCGPLNKITTYPRFEAPGKTWERYMNSKLEGEIFRSHCKKVCMVSILQMPPYQLLAKHLDYETNGFTEFNGLFFWRLIKRLYYRTYHAPIPPCIYKALAHLSRQYQSSLAVYEDYLLTFWNYHHGTEFKSKLFRWDKPLFNIVTYDYERTYWETDITGTTKYYNEDAEECEWDARPLDTLNTQMAKHKLDDLELSCGPEGRICYKLRFPDINITNMVDAIKYVYDSKKLPRYLVNLRCMCDSVPGWCRQSSYSLKVKFQYNTFYFKCFPNALVEYNKFDTLETQMGQCCSKPKRIKQDPTTWVVGGGTARAFDRNYNTKYEVSGSQDLSSINVEIQMQARGNSKQYGDVLRTQMFSVNQAARVITSNEADIKDAIQNVSEAAQNVKNYDSDIKFVIDQFKDTLSNFIKITNPERVDKLESKINTILDDVSHLFSVNLSDSSTSISKAMASLDASFTRTMRSLIELVIIVILYDFLPLWLWGILFGYRVLAWLELDHYIMDFGTWLWSTISSQSLPDIVVPKLKDWMTSFTSPQTLQTQMSVSITSLLGIITLGASALIINGKLPQKTGIERFIKTLDSGFSINRGLENIPKLLTKLTNCFDLALNYIFGRSMPEQELIDKLATIEPRVDGWAKRVCELSRAEMYIELEVNTDLQREVLGLRELANEFSVIFSDRRIPRELLIAFRTVYRDCMTLGNKVDNAKVFSEFRYDPMCVWFGGPPRIGKSALCVSVAQAMTENINEPLTSCMYTIGRAKHWDKYTKNPAVYFDDLGQDRTPEGDLRWGEFIACRSNAGYIPPQADTADKGRPFSSKIMLVSSNQLYPQTNAVATLEALWERRHLLYSCFCTPEVSDEYGVPSGTKIRRFCDANGEFSHLRFKRCNPLVVENPKSGDLTYEEMMVEVLNHQLEHDEHQRAVIKQYYDKQQQKIAARAQREELQTQMMSDETESDSEVDGVYKCSTNGRFVKIKTSKRKANPRVYVSPSERDENYSEVEVPLTYPLPVIQVLSSSDCPPDCQMVYDDPSAMMLPIQRYAADHADDLELLGQMYRFSFYDRSFVEHFEISGGQLVQKAESRLTQDMCNWLRKRLEHMPPQMRCDFYDFVRLRHEEYDSDFFRSLRISTVYTNLRDHLRGFLDYFKTTAQRVKEFCKTSLTWQRVTSFFTKAALVGGLVGLIVGGFMLHKKAKWNEEHAPLVWRGVAPDMFPCPAPVVRHLLKNGKQSELKKFDLICKQKYDEVKDVKEARDIYLINMESMAEDFDQCLAEYGISGDQKTAKPKKPKVRVQNTDTLQSQSAEDQNALDIRNNKIIQHLWVLRDKNGYAVNALALNGQNLLVPWHFACMIGDDDELQAFGSSININFKVQKKQVKRIGDLDAALIVDVKRLSNAPDIAKYFVREEDLAFIGQVNGELVTRMCTRSNDAYIVYPTEVRNLDIVPRLKQHLVDGEMFVVRKGWEHRAPTREGDCGAILLAYGSRYVRKLLGMHVSGYGGNQTGGVAITITQEMLYKHLSEFATDCLLPQKGMIKDVDECGVVPEGYEVYGQVYDEMAVWQPAKTDIIPSVLHDLVRPHVTEPSVLSAKDPRPDPGCNVWSGLEKYTEQTEPFDPSLLDVCEDYIHSEHLSMMRPLRPSLHVLDLNVAINGYPVDGYKVMDMQTSPGYPWKLNKPQGVGKGKRYLFENEGTECEPHYVPKEELLLAVLGDFKKMVRGVIPLWIWVHCLKDERRKLKKVKRAMTRFFTMAPVQLSLLSRLLTIDFVAAYLNAHNRGYSAVGIDPQSPEWTQLFDYLIAVGRNAGDGDYQTYDGKLDPDMIYRAVRLIGRWYLHHVGNRDIIVKIGSCVWKLTHSQYMRLLNILATTFVHTIQIARDIIHRKSQGNPSGNTLTTIINTIVGLFLLLLCFLLLAKDHGHWDMFNPEMFRKHVRPKIFGDDNEFTTSDQVREWYNVLTISTKLNEYNIVYTPADKEGDFVVAKDPDDLRFLKCGYRSHDAFPERKQPNIDLDTIYELTNWVRDGPDNIQQCRQQCEDALKFAYFHGARYYEQLLTEINLAIEKADFPFLTFGNQFHCLDQQWLSQFYR